MLFEDLDSFQLLQNAARNRTGSLGKVAGTSAVVLSATVVLPQSADAQTTSKVHSAGNGGFF